MDSDNCDDEDGAWDVADDKYQDSLFTRTILAHTNFIQTADALYTIGHLYN